MKAIGRYQILGLLGSGGMSRVYKVMMPVTGRILALKLLKPRPELEALLGHDRIRQLFISEAITIGRLRHPHIVEIWDVDEFEDRPYYVMDYYFNNLGVIIGETYQTESTSRAIPTEGALEYTRQTLDGLARLHAAGIVHRDIKPFNLLITDLNGIKICDFGLSKLRGEMQQQPANLKIGSPWYSAPEQSLDPDRVDFNADLYSVGVVLFRMLTGRLPVESTPPISRLNPLLGDKWDQFFTRALSPIPQSRFKHAQEMTEALMDLKDDWYGQMENICLAPASDDAAKSSASKTCAIRSEAAKVRPANGRRFFGLDNLWRPKRYAGHVLTRLSDELIEDRTSGLTWQRSGSPYPLTWHEAWAYVIRMNETAFAGKANWRMPTVNELATLLTAPQSSDDLCIEPVFDTRQRWLWSCDRRSFIAAWYVNIEMGFVGWQDFTALHFVRAVSLTDNQIPS